MPQQEVKAKSKRSHPRYISPQTTSQLLHQNYIPNTHNSHHPLTPSRFIPIFLGGVNHATGNQPPSTIKAKANYGPYDLTRGSSFYSLPPLSAPPFFPLNSLLPQRAICVVKSLYPNDKFETIYDEFWPAVFNMHIDISDPKHLAGILKRHLSNREVKKVMELASHADTKATLNANTKRAIESGAFGAPWFILENRETGRVEPMFGSDRWAYMFRFMGVEVQELTIVDKEGKAKL